MIKRASLLVLALGLLLSSGCAAWFSKSHLGSGTATAKSNTKGVVSEERSFHRTTTIRDYAVPPPAESPEAPDMELPEGAPLLRVTTIEETETTKPQVFIVEQLHEGTTVTPEMDVLGDIKDVKPPEVRLPSGVSAVGGAQEAISKYLDFMPKNSIAFWAAMVGVGLIVGGGVMALVFKMSTPGWSLAGIGFFLLVCGITFESAPWVAYVLLGAAVLGGLAYLLLYLRKKKVMSVFVNALEKTPPEVQAVVKAQVQTDAHKKRVSGVVEIEVDKTKE